MQNNLSSLNEVTNKALVLTLGNLIDSKYFVTASSNKHAFPSFTL